MNAHTLEHTSVLNPPYNGAHLSALYLTADTHVHVAEEGKKKVAQQTEVQTQEKKHCDV